MSFHDTIRQFPSRLAATLATTLAAALMATLIAAPVWAQTTYNCQAQYDQSCVHTGWAYGKQTRCLAPSDNRIGLFVARCWKGTPSAANRIHGDSLRQYTGIGWFSPQNHNSWKRYPAYFINGEMYTQARCKTGNMGESYMSGQHPHSNPPPDRTLPRDVACPS